MTQLILYGILLPIVLIMVPVLILILRLHPQPPRHTRFFLGIVVLAAVVLLIDTVQQMNGYTGILH